MDPRQLALPDQRQRLPSGAGDSGPGTGVEAAEEMAKVNRLPSVDPSEAERLHRVF